jgi:hypothetical protein
MFRGTMYEGGNEGAPNSLFNKIIAVNSEFGKKTIKLHFGNNLFGKIQNM